MIDTRPPALDRRSLLSLAAGAGAASIALPVAARAPLAGTQVPGVVRHKVGTIEVTALLDGHLPIAHAMFPSANEAAANRLTDGAFLPRGPVATPVNAYLVNLGDRLVLVDTGTATAMGPGLGHLPRNLAAAGVSPEAVDLVLITHLHPDHANGLVTSDGRAVFPNAEVIVAEAEVAFWTDAGVMSRAPAEAQPFFRMAQAAIAPYGSRLRRITPGGEVTPGITSVAAPGHTPGHTAFRIASGAAQLLIWGDIVHVGPFQFPNPDWSIAFDVDLPAAAATRRRIFDMVAADRITVAGMHLDFPGIGNVARDGTAFRFVPQPWLPL